MIPLFTQEELKNAKTNDKLPLKCKQCGQIFYKPKHYISDVHNPKRNEIGNFCSVSCLGKSKTVSGNITVKCKLCEKLFYKTRSQAIKSTNHFCSQTCAAKYNNAHKTKGTRRSKFEHWIEVELSSRYPQYNIHFNRKDAINSELDIYIPHLKLAFEFNGIFHYEPIYGSIKLKSIQNNDTRKTQACLDKFIELCIIDISSITYFKPQKAQKYLDIIIDVIEQKRQRVFEF